MRRLHQLGFAEYGAWEELPRDAVAAGLCAEQGPAGGQDHVHAEVSEELKIDAENKEVRLAVGLWSRWAGVEFRLKIHEVLRCAVRSVSYNPLYSECGAVTNF